MLLGTVISIDPTEGLTVLIDGEEEATTKKYNYLASYSPTVDDRILIEEVGDSYVIIGKVTSDYSTAGQVHYADTAGTAGTAASATTAVGDEDGNNIKTSYAASITVSSATLQLKNKNGEDLGSSVTVNNVASATSATTAGSATKATQDESGNNIKSTYAADLTVSNGKIQLKNKNGSTIGTNADLANVTSVHNNKSTSNPIYFGLLNNDLYFSTSSSYGWKKVTGTNA